MLPTPKRSKLSEQLLTHLARDIVGERLKPGELLPGETELAAQFGMSKVVARESLQALVAAGMIRVHQGKRTMVLDKGDWNTLMPAVQQAYFLEGRGAELIRPLYEVRRVLETKAAVWAAERRNPDDSAKLASALEGMRDAAHISKDTHAFLRMDLAFHYAIAQAAGNTVLRALLRYFHSAVSISWSRSRAAVEDLELMITQHARIAAAIAAGNRDEAERAMDDHLLWAQQMEASRAGIVTAASHATSVTAAR